MIILGDNCNLSGLGLPGNNIIPLITNLQASLKAPSVISSSSPTLENLPSPVTARLADPATNSVKNCRTPCDNSQQEILNTDIEEPRNESKIAWKIRAQRKRQQKHLTLGLTREEFANIQESLKHRPLECKSAVRSGLIMLL